MSQIASLCKNQIKRKQKKNESVYVTQLSNARQKKKKQTNRITIMALMFFFHFLVMYTQKNDSEFLSRRCSIETMFVMEKIQYVSRVVQNKNVSTILFMV